MVDVKSCLLVFLGGGIGSIARYLCGRLLARYEFPWSTLCVNLAGSFLIGLFARRTLDGPPDDPTRLLVIVGLLGGFTTFSAFSLENLELIKQGSAPLGVANMAIQALGGIGLAALGYALGGSLGGASSNLPS